MGYRTFLLEDMVIWLVAAGSIHFFGQGQHNRCKSAPTSYAACILRIDCLYKIRLRPIKGEIVMPVIAWLLGVPLTVVLILMLFGVF